MTRYDGADAQAYIARRNAERPDAAAGTPDWFRETPESLRALAEEREALAAEDAAADIAPADEDPRVGLTRDQYPVGLPSDPATHAGRMEWALWQSRAEVEALRAENERLQAGWTKAFDIAVSHQADLAAALARESALRAGVERLRQSYQEDGAPEFAVYLRALFALLSEPGGES